MLAPCFSEAMLPLVPQPNTCAAHPLLPEALHVPATLPMTACSLLAYLAFQQINRDKDRRPSF